MDRTSDNSLTTIQCGEIFDKRIRVFLVLFILLFSLDAFSQNRKGQIFYSRSEGQYWAAIETSYFKAYVARQHSENWCWAACTQMVLNYQGVSASQEQIVERVFGACVDRPGTAEDIVYGASGWWVDGHTIGARYDYSFVPQKIINDLVNKYPLVVGLRMPGQTVGHAYVLTGLSFQKIGELVYPNSVILRDPWPDSQSRVELTWEDFSSRAQTIVHIFPNQ